MMQFLHDSRFIQFYTEYTERSHWTSAIYGLDFLCVRTGPVPRPIAHHPRQVVLYWYAIPEPEERQPLELIPHNFQQKYAFPNVAASMKKNNNGLLTLAALDDPIRNHHHPTETGRLDISTSD